MPPQNEIALTVDTSGRHCPVPLIEMSKGLRTLPVGSILELVTTDPASRIDVPVGCHRLGHDLMSEKHEQGVFRFLIRKCAPAP